MIGAFSQTLSSPVGRAHIASASSALAAFAVLLAVVIFTLATFTRTVVLGAADLTRVTPSFLTPWQMRGVLLVLVLAPALYFAAPAYAIVAALAIAAPHLNVRDRVVGVTLLAMTAAVPMWLETSLEAGRAARASADVRPAVVGLCDAACLEDLDRASLAGDGDAKLALAWWSWREGLPESRAAAAAAIETIDDAPHRAASLATLRGHLALAADDRDGAATHYRRARELAVGADQVAATAFNLYRINMLRDDTAGARTALREASSANGPLVNLNVEYTGRAQNRLVLPCPFEPDVTWQAATLLAPSRSDAVERLLASVLAWPASLRPAAMPAGALAIWLMLAWPLRRSMRLSQPCRRCGTASSPAFSPDAARAGVCVTCHELATDQRLSFTQRSARERRIESTHLLRLLATLSLGVAAPGSATIARGATLRGTLFLLVGVVGIVLWTPLAGDFATLMRPLGESEPHLSPLFGMWLHGLAAFAAVIDGLVHFGRRH